MTEVVALAHAHEADVRAPRLQREWCQSIAAAVVWDLQHVDRGQPIALGQGVQDASFGVAGECHLEITPHHPEYHAGVVRRQVVGEVGGGRHNRHARSPERPGVAGVELAHVAAKLLGDVTGHLVCGAHAHPPDSDKTAEPVDAGCMVSMVVCEHQRVDAAHAMAPQRLAEHGCVRAGIDEHHSARVAQKNGVTLSDVENGHRRSAGGERPDCDHEGRADHGHDPAPRLTPLG